MLKVRLPIAIALIAGLLAILRLDYESQWRVGCHLLFMAVVVLCLLEVYGLIESDGRTRPVKSIGVLAALALCVGEWLSYHPALRGQAVSVWSINGIVLSVTVLLLLGYHSRPETWDGAVGSVSATLFGILYVWFLGSYLTKIVMLEFVQVAGRDLGIPCLFLTLMVAKFSDTGAYFFGKTLGRTKLCPSISPNKTVEGAFGGVLTSLGVACLLQWQMRIPFLDWSEVTIFGLVVGIAAELGDLAESLLKRFCRAKDSSSILPGLGGVLDVFDSLLAAGPASYVLLLLFSRTW
jgi:phosphatidate cytidylyltransferase